MEPDWVLLCSCNTLLEAQVIKSSLNENEIVAVILNKQDSSYLFGEHEVFVNRDEILKAKNLIQIR